MTTAAKPCKIRVTNHKETNNWRSCEVCHALSPVGEKLKCPHEVKKSCGWVAAVTGAWRTKLNAGFVGNTRGTTQ